MPKHYEVVRHQGDATVYRLKGGRAEVLIYDKAAVTSDEILAECVAAERQLGHDLDANDDITGSWKGRRPDPLVVVESDGGIRAERGQVSIGVLDHELPELMAAARKRWEASFEKRKREQLDKVKRTREAYDRAQAELDELKKLDPNRYE